MLQLTVEERELALEIEALTQALAPQLLHQPGVGPHPAAQLVLSWSHPGRIHSEAAFARLAGAAPIALHQILLTRRRTHPPTIAYIERRLTEGKTRREANRCLKRYLAHHL